MTGNGTRESAPFLIDGDSGAEEREKAEARIAAFDRGQKLLAEAMVRFATDGELGPMSREELEQARYEYLLEKY